MGAAEGRKSRWRTVAFWIIAVTSSEFYLHPRVVIAMLS